MLGSMRRWVTVTAPEVRIADTGVTLRSRVVTVRLPFGVLVWNRPVAVQILRNGQLREFAISGRRTTGD